MTGLNDVWLTVSRLSLGDVHNGRHETLLLMLLAKA